MATQVRENFPEDCEALINQQICIELSASYTYLYMAYYFEKDTIALPGLAKFFKKASDEERQHAQMFMEYQNNRGGNIVLQDIPKPCQDYDSTLQILQTALEMEKEVNKKLLIMSAKASELGDPHLTKFLDDHFLDEQVQSIKELADMCTRLKRAGPKDLGEYLFDKEFQ